MMIRWWVRVYVEEPYCRRVIGIGSTKLMFELDNHTWCHWKNLKHYNLFPGPRHLYGFKAIFPYVES